MPTYEYRCKKCGFRFEEFQSIVDKPLTVCPSCGGELERLVSGGAGLIFKGSGFYITDYAKNKNSGKPGGKPESKSKPDSKKEDKTKSKKD